MSRRIARIGILMLVLMLAASLLAPLFSKKSFPPPSIRNRISEARNFVRRGHADKVTPHEILAQSNLSKQTRGEWMLSLGKSGEVTGIETPWFDLTEIEEREYLRFWQKRSQYRVRVEGNNIFEEQRNGPYASVITGHKYTVPLK